MMVEQDVQITNIRGLHARASSKFVTMASGLSASVTVRKDGSEPVCGTSIMGLMMLGAAKGDVITIRAEGEGKEMALEMLVALVQDKFGEE